VRMTHTLTVPGERDRMIHDLLLCCEAVIMSALAVRCSPRHSMRR
jgi:hypothetical protein